MGGSGSATGIFAAWAMLSMSAMARLRLSSSSRAAADSGCGPAVISASGSGSRPGGCSGLATSPFSAWASLIMSAMVRTPWSQVLSPMSWA